MTKFLPRATSLAGALVALAACPVPAQSSTALSPAKVTITRDEWGIAHVHGATDADAVFGMVYAQS